MIRLRAAQMNAFRAASQRALVSRLVGVLQSRHAELVGKRSTADLEVEVLAAVAVADRHRIEYESHVYQFAVLFLALGADFEQRPDARWAADILKSALPAETRLYQLREAYLQRPHAAAS
jgi:hypothetical protein